VVPVEIVKAAHRTALVYRFNMYEMLLVTYYLNFSELFAF